MGLPTVCVGTGRDLMTQVRPPRAVFVNAPMGNNFGRPGDAVTQRRILQTALDLVASAPSSAGGVLVDVLDVWDEDFTPSVERTLGAMSPS
jgi:hypothetical protein